MASEMTKRFLEKAKKTDYIELSDLVPEDWKSWFYNVLSCTNQVSYGDANRTLVTGERLANIVDNLYDMIMDETDDTNLSEKEIDDWINAVRELGNMYVDLEN